ncbi:F-box/LRR-repeat protein [Tanacetum coccineum]
METRKSPGLEDIPYLFHHILSLLPVKEAACTCVLSKSWLHAWSTIPKLRFNQSIMLLKQLDDYINLIHRTLLRYFEHNIPVVSFDLKIGQESASLVEKMIEQWIRGLAPKRCFNDNELCITFADECCWTIKYTLPDEIFSGVNLTIISVTVDVRYLNTVEMCRNPVINCVSLRVLELLHVNTSEERLMMSQDFACLLTVHWGVVKPSTIQPDSIRRRDRIVARWYKGYIIPKLSFPTIAPKQVNLTLWLNSLVDHLFFLKMREALSLASNFDIEISYWSSDIVVPLNIDIDNLRRKVPYPATNVRQLLVEIDFEERMGAYLQFIDTFFSICHPNYLRVYRDKPSKDINSYKQMVKWMIEMKMPEFIDVKIKDPNTGNWEDQTNVWRSSPENFWLLVPGMEGARSSLQIRAPEIDDFPEFIHRIQSLLPVKEGIRTCVLSKTCLQLCSTT